MLDLARIEGQALVHAACAPAPLGGSSAAVSFLRFARLGTASIGIIEAAVSRIALVARLSRSRRTRSFHRAADRLLGVGTSSNCRLKRIVVELRIGDLAQGDLLVG